jgi:CubicO group peptidase (beta-lactamase class C family)
MKLIKLPLFLILLPFTLFADINTINKAQSKAIDKIFTDWDKKGTPGCGLGVIKDGKLIYARGYGIANLEYDLPNNSKSVYRIGSTSKQFTAASIVLLVEKGKLSLDDNLNKFYPEFPDYAKNITIRHLLNHTSGIRDYLTLSFLKGLGDNDFFTDKDVMHWLINQTELNFAPGEEFVYSNSGYWLLGQIVNQVAEMTMAEFAKKEMFIPLEMNSTHFHNDHTQIVKNRASGYIPKGEIVKNRDPEYIPKVEEEFQISMTTLEMIGDGGIFTSIEDIKKWDDAYYDSKVLSKNFWGMMTQQGKLNNNEEIDYASGLFVSKYKGLKTVSHGGAFVGFRAELLRFPEQEFSIAIFTNRGDANPTSMAYKVADVFLSDQYVVVKKETKEDSNVSTETDEFSYDKLMGTYELDVGVDITMSVKEDKLHAKQHWNEKEYDLIKIENNTYQIDNEDAPQITFTFTDLKNKLTQNLTIDNAGRITESKRKEDIDLSGTKLEDFVGDFYSKELEVSYKIFLEDGLLKVRVKNNDSVELSVTKEDLLNYQGIQLKYSRSNGVVDGFTLNAGRVKNLKFTKQ